MFGSTINLNGNPTGGSGTYATHNWTGAGAAYLSATNIANPVFNAPVVVSTTTYALNYQVTDNLGCASSLVSTTVTVSPIPTISAAPPAPSICSGQSTGITLSSSAATPTFTWTIGAITGGITGATAGNDNSAPYQISQMLTNPGTSNGTVTYNVTVSGAGGCTASTAVVVTVRPLPDIIVTNNAPTICSGQNTNINLSGSIGSTNFAWSATNTGTATGSSAGSGGNPSSITQNLTGNGTVTYTVTPTASGCTGNTANTIVTVNPNNTASIANITACQNSGTVTPTVTGATGGTFSTPAGLSINPTTGDINTNTSTPNTYNVTYTPPPPCSVVTNFTVTISPTVATTVQHATRCTTAPTFTPVITGVGGGTFSSGTPAGLSINTTTGLITPSTSTPGTYTVTYTPPPASCSPPTNFTITINAPTTPTVPNIVACVGDGLTPITPSVPGGTYTVQSASNGGTLTILGNNVDVDGSDWDNVYTVLYTPPAGCYTTTTFTVTINAVIEAELLAAPTTICAGQSATLTFNVIGNGPFDIEYTDGITTFQLFGVNSGHTVSVSPSTTTTYSLVSAVSVAGCGTGVFMGTPTITVNPAPGTPGVISGGPNFCANGTGTYSIAAVPNATNYTWTVTGGAISSGQGTTSINVNWNPSITTATVCVTASNTCGTSPQQCLNLTDPAPTITCPAATSVTLPTICQIAIPNITPIDGAVLANSVSEFSNTQGTNNWYYGQYFANSSCNFAQLPNYNGGAAQWQDSQPFSTPYLNNNSGHPGVSDYKWAVRRWVSEYTGNITLNLGFQDLNTGCGNGAHIRIFVNGVEVWQYFNVPAVYTTWTLPNISDMKAILSIWSSTPTAPIQAVMPLF
ncbi:MAG: hypothetical protein IPL33_19255 [Sphingobacteriales bacterium]|nr:hypothetical protein [Sphingobacteriales bacterium]